MIERYLQNLVFPYNLAPGGSTLPRGDAQKTVTGIFERLSRLLAAWRERIRQESVHREAIEHLESMSDAQLRDIGITRADIADAVRFGRHYYLDRESE